jgi:nucleoid-associated protein YgaU
MVLVVVIWGRSPRPDDTLATPKGAPEKAKTPGAGTVVADRADAAPGSNTDVARDDAAHPSPLPGDAAMMNHLQPPDRARMSHQPGSPVGDDTAPRPADNRTDPAPVPPADRGTPVAGGPSAPAPAVTHVVAKGDTLMKLAAKYYRDQNKWRLIQQANRGVSVLQIGQKVTIPPLPDAPSRAADSTSPSPTGPAPAPGDRPGPAGPSLDHPAGPTPPAPTPAGSKTYTVQKGDTFMKIARSIYRDPGKWRTLYQRNRAKLPDPAKPDSLRPGTVIEVPAVASR